MRMRVAVWVAVASLGVSFAMGASVARADVVGPPPTDCPLGARGSTCHGMEYCSPRSCTTGADCAGGEICQSRDLCVTSRSCGGRLEPDAGPPPPVTVVLGECSGGACGTGACESRMVCVPDGTPPGTGGGGCACSASGREGTWLGLAVALVAVSAFAVRRRL
ncbi:MAG: hypothetical protein KF729_30950 [Sandaracinaceae bacterium]|nr:hypothetical protein [Sandaracinaceae bacterium]